MDIHKPKAWHSFREFLKEYLIIVVGVLTALGAEQVVETLHWRHAVAEAADSMRLELRDDDLPQAYARVAIYQCLVNQLDHIEAALDAGRERQDIAALARAYAPPVRTWDMEAWRAALAGDFVSHVGAKRAGRWSAPYSLIPTLDETARREGDGLSSLTAGERRTGRLSEIERERLTLAVQVLRGANQRLMGGSRVLLLMAYRAGIEMPRADKAKVLADLRPVFGPCVIEPPAETSVRLSNAGGTATLMPDR